MGRSARSHQIGQAGIPLQDTEAMSCKENIRLSTQPYWCRSRFRPRCQQKNEWSLTGGRRRTQP